MNRIIVFEENNGKWYLEIKTPFYLRTTHFTRLRMYWSVYQWKQYQRFFELMLGHPAIEDVSFSQNKDKTILIYEVEVIDN